MLTDDLAKGENTVASLISSKDILILGGHNNLGNKTFHQWGTVKAGITEAYIYDAISNTVKPQNKLLWQGGELGSIECDANQCGVTRMKEVIALVTNKLDELNLIMYNPEDSSAKIVVNYGKTYKHMASTEKKQEFDLEYERARAEEFGDQR